MAWTACIHACRGQEIRSFDCGCGSTAKIAERLLIGYLRTWLTGCWGSRGWRPYGVTLAEVKGRKRVLTGRQITVACEGVTT